MKKDDDPTLGLAERTHHMVDSIVKIAMIETQKQSGNGPDAVYVGVMGCLAAAMATAAVIAKKPEWTKKLVDEADGPEGIDAKTLVKITASLTTPETVMFSALAAVYTMQDLNETGNLHSAFGPPQLWQALQAWSKIFPDRLADNYFDPKMLDAARNAGKRISEPFDAFLAGRITHKHSPDSLN